MNNENLKLYNSFGMKNYFIGYFDILGFENMVNQGKKEKDLILLTSISDCITNSNDVISQFSETENSVDIKMKVFSDNFFFCTEKDYIHLLSLIASLQTSFIPLNIFIRGSLSYGRIVFDNNFLYGKGLIDAYKIESEIAIYPRIIIDDSFFTGATLVESDRYSYDVSVNQILLSLKNCYSIDFDSNKFIDYLGMKKYTEDNTKETYDKYPFIDLIKDNARNISYNIQTENKRIKQKYQWCRNYHNAICERYNFPECLI